MTPIFDNRLMAGFLLAFSLIPSSAMAWIAHGFPGEEPVIQQDMGFLSGFRSSSKFLPKAGLSSRGFELVGRVEDRFPIVLHESVPVKGCARKGVGNEITSCEVPFEEWKTLDASLLRTPIPGVWVYAPYLDTLARYKTPIMIGIDKNRWLTVDSLSQVILVLDQSFLNQSMNFDTESARRHFRIGAYIGAARVFDALISDKKPLEKCALGLGVCDVYRDGANTQTAAYYLDAAMSCKGCSSIDKAALINLSAKILTATPVDADVDVLTVIRTFQNIVNKKTIPEALVEDLEDRKILKIGLSPRID